MYDGKFAAVYKKIEGQWKAVFKIPDQDALDVIIHVFYKGDLMTNVFNPLGEVHIVSIDPQYCTTLVGPWNHLLDLNQSQMN